MSSAPAVSRLLETAVYVDDLERAAGFYASVMGLPLLVRTASLAAFGVVAQGVLLVFLRGASTSPQAGAAGVIPPHDGAGPLHLAFGIEADTLPAWEAWLAVHGVAIEGRMRWPRGGTSLYFRDPDGHLLELATRGLWTVW